MLVSDVNQELHSLAESPQCPYGSSQRPGWEVSDCITDRDGKRPRRTPVHHIPFRKNCDHPCVCHCTSPSLLSPFHVTKQPPVQTQPDSRLSQIRVISKLARTVPEPRVSWGPRSECPLQCRVTPEAHQAENGVSLLGMETAEATKVES